jgi:hypothetical protein
MTCLKWMNDLMKESSNLSRLFDTPTLSINTLGQCALNILRKDGDILAMGVTSKGVYLQDQDSQVCFLTQEAFHGPITINLNQGRNFKTLFKVGEGCRIRIGRLLCQNCQVVVQKDTPVWVYYEIQIEKRQLPQAVRRGTQLARELSKHYEDGLFFPFLKTLSSETEKLDRQSLIEMLPRQVHNATLFDRLRTLIGFGDGLTPAGDDFICGFLLTCSCLDRSIHTSLSNKLHIDELKAQTRERTTSLSATLIDCAAQGMADERVLNVLQWLFADNEDLGKIKKELLTYGSSSGVDTFSGMLAAILLQHEELE